MSILKMLKFGPVLHRSLLKSIRHYNDIPFEDIPEVSPSLIKKTLKDGRVVFEEGFTCFIASCPLCPKSAKSNLQNLYVNKETGMFMCSSCKYSGQWDFLQKHFASTKKRKTGVDVDFRAQLDESLKQVRGSTEVLVKSDGLSDILRKFKLPPVSSSTVERIDIRIDKTSHNLYFPLEDVQSQVVGYKKINAHTGRELVIPDLNFGGLLTGKAAKNKDSAVLVSNIPDFLVLFNARINHNIVCLPNGVNNLSQYFLPSLERFKKLILWFGNDIRSWDSARHFSKKLNEKRCLFVRPNENQLLPHLVEEQELRNVINGAQPIWHKSITTFASLREDVWSDLRNIDKVQGVKWKRFPSLNKILKGHRRGELTVITGPTGSGKTTFISEYSLDLANQGVNTLWGSFEIRNVRLARTMLQQFCGSPLDSNLHLFQEWADKFELLPIYFMTFHGQQSVKVVMEAVEHATYVHDIAHVIIDNLQFMMGMNEEQKHMDRFWKQDAIIAAFRSFATRRNCHVSLVIHPRKEKHDEDLTTSSIFGGAKASQEADNILIIQDKRLTSVKGKKYLQVAKNRFSGDLGVMPLDFNKSGLSYAQKKKKEEKVNQQKMEDPKSSEQTVENQQSAIAQ